MTNLSMFYFLSGRGGIFPGAFSRGFISSEVSVPCRGMWHEIDFFLLRK